MIATRRGRLVLFGAAVLILAALIVGALALNGKGPAAGLGSLIHKRPPPCPLTGQRAPDGTVPQRPALAIKVENLPESRPQTGLDDADIVYEEPVEAGITRFIVVYQCREAARVEPVRSARLEDPDVLKQFGHPLFGYAGGVPKVVAKVAKYGIHDVNFIKAASEYSRDPSRPAPHNLYTSTSLLWKLAPKNEKAPAPIFTYSKDKPTGPSASVVHLLFSGYSDVYWRWDAKRKVYLRFHGTVPHMLSDGKQVEAKNVVVQVVRVTLSQITDVNGVHSPYAHLIGSGKAYVFRNGRVVTGTWSRHSLGELTTFTDANGKEISLQPGNTWVELYPSTLPVSYSK
jgi:hypothetical protein